MKLRGIVPPVIAMMVLAGCGGDGSSPVASETTATTPAPVSDDPIVATPSTANPGELVELTFPTELERGAPWYVSRWTGKEWSQPLYLVIASQENGYNADGPDWRPKSEGWGWDDIGFAGPGPDTVVIPETAEAGTYRYCTANASGGPYCVNVSVSEDSTS